MLAAERLEVVVSAQLNDLAADRRSIITAKRSWTAEKNENPERRCECVQRRGIFRAEPSLLFDDIESFCTTSH